jgi:hypothetical protein
MCQEVFFCILTELTGIKAGNRAVPLRTLLESQKKGLRNIYYA